MPLLPRKNVQQERAERDDSDHQSTAGKTMSATTTLPPLLLWLGHKLTSEILAFGVKVLFDYASERG